MNKTSNALINFFKHPIVVTREIIWVLRIYYQKVKEKITNFFSKVFAVIKKPFIATANLFSNLYKSFYKN